MICTIVLDEDPTIKDAMEADDERSSDEDGTHGENGKEDMSNEAKRARLLADYAKAKIPNLPWPRQTLS